MKHGMETHPSETKTILELMVEVGRFHFVVKDRAPSKTEVCPTGEFVYVLTNLFAHVLPNLHNSGEWINGALLRGAHHSNNADHRGLMGQFLVQNLPKLYE